MNHNTMPNAATPFGFSGDANGPALGSHALADAPDHLVHEPEAIADQTCALSGRLETLRGMLLSLVRRDGRDLTARQLTACMTVYLDPQVHTVSSMAEMLNISRPGVTRLLDRLAEYDLIARQEDRHDRRRVLIRRTARGAAFLHELEDIVRTDADALHA